MTKSKHLAKDFFYLFVSGILPDTNAGIFFHQYKHF